MFLPTLAFIRKLKQVEGSTYLLTLYTFQLNGVSVPQELPPHLRIIPTCRHVGRAPIYNNINMQLRTYMRPNPL